MICTSSASQAMALLFTGVKYAALFSDDPTQSGLFTHELTGGSYVRKPVTFSSPNGRTVHNEGEELWWADLTAVPIRYIGVCSAITGGTMVAYQLVSATGIVLPTGQRFYVPGGDLAFSLD